MKSFFLALAVVCLFLCENASAQKITYQDLHGIWHNADASKRKFSIEFIDTSHLIICNSLNQVSNGTYKLKTVGNDILLIMTLNKEGINHYDQYIVSFIKPDTIKFEN